MTNFQEAMKIPATRGLPDVYRVRDVFGKFHGFYSAKEANDVFPGAFDAHPDDEDEAA